MKEVLQMGVGATILFHWWACEALYRYPFPINVPPFNDPDWNSKACYSDPSITEEGIHKEACTSFGMLIPEISHASLWSYCCHRECIVLPVGDLNSRHRGIRRESRGAGGTYDGAAEGYQYYPTGIPDGVVVWRRCWRRRPLDFCIPFTLIFVVVYLSSASLHLGMRAQIVMCVSAQS
ncbi:hypothetical protein BV22DRAFT_843996 [Leucogyrophana mollusca]|uniref:Uncharacterized protein n=1 Tax=Leucogyrophana mollusca TaxID=85980 RepID=A0ACB8B368_9AGAM|nr:hypothetical protein BV22DRAFT_843996 [Leucogyrophana mollusca]